MVSVDMKGVVMGFLLVLVLSSFVIAESSEIIANFNIGSVDEGKDYVPSTSFWDVYGGYVVGLIIVLIIVVVFSKSRKPKVVKKVKRRKVVHKEVKRKKK